MKFNIGVGNKGCCEGMRNKLVAAE